MNNEINLLEVSSVTQKKRRRPFKSDTSDVICLETNPSSQKGPETKRGDAGEVIDLASPLFQNKVLPGRSRSSLELAPIINVDDDPQDEIIEILSPAVAKMSSVATAKTPVLYDLSTTIVDRIREVFPLVSRQKVQSFLGKASTYMVKGDETDHDMMQIVMTVLSEYPLGENIPDEAFATAAVGGHIDAKSEQFQIDDTDSTAGKQKIAQLECNCCFVEYPFEEMVSCRSAGHLFCKTCLQKHTEQRLFGLGNLGVKNDNNNNKLQSKSASKALEILCMHPSGCNSGFHEWQLRKALSAKVIKKYDEMQYAAVIEQANTNGDISRCPKCDFIAFAEKTLTTFHCPQCSYKSCRECGEEAHPGIKCDEVESKTQTDGRKNVEEAMTQALVRTCPRPFCRKKFLKTDGCNKMTCACGAFVCYVCRQEIPKSVAYNHFCQTPHCNHKSCGKCALYANVEKDDEKRVKAAAKKAAKKQKTDVDVEALLKDPKSHASANARHGRAGGGAGGGAGAGRNRVQYGQRIHQAQNLPPVNQIAQQRAQQRVDGRHQIAQQHGQTVRRRNRRGGR